MDDNFDALSRGLASGISRRRALLLMAGGVAASVLGLSGLTAQPAGAEENSNTCAPACSGDNPTCCADGAQHYCCPGSDCASQKVADCVKSG
jgi:hypothetical protein